MSDEDDDDDNSVLSLLNVEDVVRSLLEDGAFFFDASRRVVKEFGV